jgi:SAM-dependent methyltransferase
MNPYRQRVWEALHAALAPLGCQARALDFGSGDGWFARQMLDSKRVDSLVAVDVKLRPNVLTVPTIYDGVRLPFADRSFDLVYAIDVLHHCPDPAASLVDALRCAGQYFLLKDHTYTTKAGQWTLTALDELGNRKFGIPCPARYQRGWTWNAIFHREGFQLIQQWHPHRSHVGPLGWLTNGLQFVALWKRAEAP